MAYSSSHRRPPQRKVCRQLARRGVWCSGNRCVQYRRRVCTRRMNEVTGTVANHAHAVAAEPWRHTSGQPVEDRHRENHAAARCLVAQTAVWQPVRCNGGSGSGGDMFIERHARVAVHVCNGNAAVRVRGRKGVLHQNAGIDYSGSVWRSPPCLYKVPRVYSPPCPVCNEEADPQRQAPAHGPRAANARLYRESAS